MQHRRGLGRYQGPPRDRCFLCGAGRTEAVAGYASEAEGEAPGGVLITRMTGTAADLVGRTPWSARESPSRSLLQESVLITAAGRRGRRPRTTGSAPPS